MNTVKHDSFRLARKVSGLEDSFHGFARKITSRLARPVDIDPSLCGGGVGIHKVICPQISSACTVRAGVH